MSDPVGRTSYGRYSGCMAISSIHGFPRIGPNRELKFATEGYWRDETSADELQNTARAIRRANWELMRDAGIDLIPSNDFSLYDHVLDTAALVGAVPERYGHEGGEVALDTYFAMARGRADATAMEMTKWFDTNYHYLVPELGPGMEFRLAASPKPLTELAEARELGIATRPVLLGPVSFLLLAKGADGGSGSGPRLAGPAAGGLRRAAGGAGGGRGGVGPAGRAGLRPGPLAGRAGRPRPRLRPARPGPGAAQAAGLQLLRPPGRRPRRALRHPG